MKENKNRVVFALLTILLLSMAAAGCITYGYAFPTNAVSKIHIGETTRLQIGDMFGPPVRTGMEDGKVTWTYLHYRYSLIGPTETRDLVIRFDEKGVVTSYTYNSSYPEDQMR